MNMNVRSADSALLPVRIQQGKPARNWLARALAVLCLILLFGWMDASDQASNARLAADLYARNAERLYREKQAVEDAPAIRIDLDNKGGFNCTSWRVRESWIGAAAERCAQLGQFLIMARSVE